MSFPPTPPPIFSVPPPTTAITHRNLFDPKSRFAFVGFICSIFIILLIFIFDSYHRRQRLFQTRVHDDIESRFQESRVFAVILAERAPQPSSPPPQKAEVASAATTIIKAEEIVSDCDCDCAICIEGFADKQVCRVIEKCGHFFHKDCVDQWLTIERRCPLCRCFVLLVSENSHENQS